MRINLLSDADWQTKVPHAYRLVNLDPLTELDYGPGLSALVMCLICRDPALGFKQRVRHTKANNTLYIDVMLDLPFFVSATHVERRRKIYDSVTQQVGEVLKKRKIKEFEWECFLVDLGNLLDDQLNGEQSTKLDKFCLERATGF